MMSPLGNGKPRLSKAIAPTMPSSAEPSMGPSPGAPGTTTVAEITYQQQWHAVVGALPVRGAVL